MTMTLNPGSEQYDGQYVDPITVLELELAAAAYAEKLASLPRLDSYPLVATVGKTGQKVGQIARESGHVIKDAIELSPEQRRALGLAGVVVGSVAGSVFVSVGNAEAATPPGTTTEVVVKGETPSSIAYPIAVANHETTDSVLNQMYGYNPGLSSNTRGMQIGSTVVVPIASAPTALPAPAPAENAATTSVIITPDLTEWQESINLSRTSGVSQPTLYAEIVADNTGKLDPNDEKIGSVMLVPLTGANTAATPPSTATPENAATETVHLQAGQTIYMYAVPTAKQEGISLTAAETQIEQASDIDPANVDRLPEGQPAVVLDSAAVAVASQEDATPTVAVSTPVAAPAESTYDLIAEHDTTYSALIGDIEKEADQTPSEATANLVQDQAPTDIGLHSTIQVHNITAAQGAAIQADLNAAANVSEPAATMAPEAIAAPAVPAPEAPATGGAAQLTAEQALEISNNSENSPNPYLEQWAIGTLTQLAQAQGIPLTDTLTQEHVTFLMAWAWVEKGDLDNNGTYNMLNTGVDVRALLATSNNASGLQAFISQQAGETADVDTFLSGYQNRIGRILSDPSSTAEDCISTLTWFENAPGDQPWAGMDNPAEGFSQTEYQDTLLSMLSWVRANYAFAGTVPLGYTYDMYKPHVATSLLQFSGTGPLSSGNSASAPVTPTTTPAAPAPTTTTTLAPTTPTTSPAQSRVPLPSKAPTTTTTNTTPAPTTTTQTTTPEVTLPSGVSISSHPGDLGFLAPDKNSEARASQK